MGHSLRRAATAIAALISIIAQPASASIRELGPIPNGLQPSLTLPSIGSGPAAAGSGLVATVLPPEAVSAGVSHQVFAEEFNAPLSYRAEKSADGSTTSGTWSRNFWYDNENVLGAHDDYSKNTDVSLDWSGDNFHVVNGGSITMYSEDKTLGASYPSSSKYVDARSFIGSILDTKVGPNPSNTGAGFEFKYGYAEARMKVEGDPYWWPTFWLWSDSTGAYNRVNEIDIAEFNTAVQNTVYQTPHEWDPRGTGYGQLNFNTVYGSVTGTSVSAAYHTYGLLWEPDKLVFYVDGVATGTMTVASYPWIAHLDAPMFLILSNGGGEFPNSGSHMPPAGSVGTIQVDYVRVYQ